MIFPNYIKINHKILNLNIFSFRFNMIGVENDKSTRKHQRRGAVPQDKSPSPRWTTTRSPSPGLLLPSEQQDLLEGAGDGPSAKVAIEIKDDANDNKIGGNNLGDGKSHTVNFGDERDIIEVPKTQSISEPLLIAHQGEGSPIG